MAPTLTERRLHDLLLDKGPMTKAEIAREFSVSKSQVSALLNGLRYAGAIEREVRWFAARWAP